MDRTLPIGEVAESPSSRPQDQDRDEALHRSEEQFRLLVESVTEYAIFQLDQGGHVTSWNAGAEHIKGYTREEILGQHFSTFYPSDSVEAGMPDRVLETARREGQWTGEGWRVRKDGEHFWAHVTVTALRDDHGELRGFAKVTRDMSVRHKREEELARETNRTQEAKRRLEREKALLELMQTVTATANDAERLGDAMQETVDAVCRHTGWPVGHVYRLRRGDGPRSEPHVEPTGIWHLADEERFEAFRRVTEEAVFALGESLPGRVAARGAPVWISDVTDDPNVVRAGMGEELGVKGAFGVPVRVEEKTVAVLEFFSAEAEEPDERLLEAVASVGVQLSRVAEREQARAELEALNETLEHRIEERTKALEQSKARLSALLDQLPAGVGMFDSEGRWLIKNPHLKRIVPNRIPSHDPDERPYWRTWSDDGSLVDPSDWPGARALRGETVRPGMDFLYTPEDGNERWLRVRATPFRNSEGEITGAIATVDDVTEHKRIEEELREREERFRAFVNASSNVVYRMSPDWTEMRDLDGQGFIADTESPTEAWMDQYIHPDDQPQVREAIEEAIRTKSMFDLEHRVRRADGTLGWTHSRAVPIFGDEGEIVEWFGAASDVTERKCAEEELKRLNETLEQRVEARTRELRESEAKFRALAEESPTGITVIHDGRFKYVNATYAEIFGYERDEMIESLAAEDVVHPDDRRIVRENLRRRIEGEVDAVHFQVRGLTKDGEVRELEVRGRRLIYERRPAVIGSILDVTERKEAKEALRRSERHYRRLFEEAQEGIALSTLDGEIVDVNSAAEDIFGYSREELLQMNTTELYVDPAEQQKGKELMAEEGALRNFEVRVRRKDGKEIICQLSSTARRGPDGEIKAIQTFLRDVTEKKRAEKALKESERRFRRLFEESRDAVVLTTPEGDIIDVNGAAEALFGYSQDELLRLDASELYADPAERKRRILPALKKATSSRVLEAEMRHKDGHTFLASASVTVHRDEEGQPELIQALVRDITDQRRLQREVLRVQEEERRRLGQDLHDGVASQLTGIGIMLCTLTRRVDNNDGLSDDIQKAQELVQESCQDIRRLSRGLSPAGLSEGGLPSALRRLAENVEGGVFEGGIEELSELEGDAAAHLYWIAQEATTNARKYAEAGEIAIRLTREEDAFTLEVEDDGRGFDPNMADEGSLGLRTMRYRADLLGATLTIDTAPGEGTRVRCRLPG